MSDAISSLGTWSQVPGGTLETVACPVCSHAQHTFILKRPDHLNVVSCAACRVYYINPQPTQATLGVFYSTGYFEGQHDFYRGKSYFETRAQSLGAGNLTGWDFVRAHCDVRGKAFMDLGCASGEMLVLAQKNGASSARGIELDEKAASYGRATYSLDISIGTIEDKLVGRESVDIITAFDVIEHLKQPLVAFERIANALAPDGVFLCGTPNGQCIERWGREWIGLNKDFEHLLYPRPSDLKHLAERVGLELTHHHSQDNPLPMRQYQSAGANRVLRLVREPGVSWHNAVQKVRAAMWLGGVGHTLFAVLRKPHTR